MPWQDQVIRRLGIRSTVRRRAMGQCEICGEAFTRNAKGQQNASMHHRLMRRHGGVDGITNLIHICMSCHRKLHKNEKAERYSSTKGYISWVDSSVTPLWLHRERWVVLTERGAYEPIEPGDADVLIEWLKAYEPLLQPVA